MSDFVGADSIVAALRDADTGVSGCRQEFNKTSLTSVAGFDYSGWMMGGYPPAGGIPGTTWAIPNHATTGSWNPKMVNPGTRTNRIILTEATLAIAGANLRFVDRLGHMAGLSGTSTAVQNVNGEINTPATVQGRCNADGSDVSWFLEWYQATGSTVAVATVNVTYDDDSTGNIAITIAASTPAYRMLKILPAVAGRFIKKVNTVQLSGTTGTVGNFGVTAYKFLCSTSVITANWTDKQDYAYLGMPKVGSYACIHGIWWTTATALGITNGVLVIGGA